MKRNRTRESLRCRNASPRLARREFLKRSGIASLSILTAQTWTHPLLAESDAMDTERSGSSDVVTMFLCGDVMTGRGIDQILPHPSNPGLCEPYATSALRYVEIAEKASGLIPRPVSFSYVWGVALEELARVRPDVRIINLETAVTQSAECVPKGINYKMNPDNIPCLTAAEIDCCVLANNHVLDWDYSGLTETLETLETANLRPVGAGRNAAQAEAPAVIELAAKGRVLVFGLGSVTSGIPPEWAAGMVRPGVNLLEIPSGQTVGRIAEKVREVKRPGDIVIASIHWGANWGYRIPHEQRELAHKLIDDAGIDVIHGHSSHHVKAIEVYKEKPILYGCGDFLNDYEGIGGHEEFRGDLALMYFPSAHASSGKLADFKLRPLRIRKFRLNHASRRDGAWLQDTLNRESGKFGTRVELSEDNTLTVLWRRDNA